MREADQVRLPGGSRVAGGEEKSLFQRFAKQILMSIIASLVAGLILNFTGVKQAVLYACSAAIHLGGDPISGKGGLIDKIDDKLEDVKKQQGKLPLGVPNLNPLRRSPEEIEALARQKEAERERRETAERNTLIARADAAGLAHRDDWTLEKLRVEVGNAERQAEEKQQREAEALERKTLIDRATAARLGVNPDLPLAEMRKQVEAAEAYVKADADYQLKLRQWEIDMQAYREDIASGPNANCPRCRFPLRLPTSNTQRQAMCPNDKYVCSRAVMLARHRNPPPPRAPKPPDMNPGLLGRFFR